MRFELTLGNGNSFKGEVDGSIAAAVMSAVVSTAMGDVACKANEEGGNLSVSRTILMDENQISMEEIYSQYYSSDRCFPSENEFLEESRTMSMPINTLRYDSDSSNFPDERPTFFNCKKCGKLQFRFAVPGDIVACFFCNEEHSTEGALPGYYKCENCYTSSTFYTKEVETLSCKNCKSTIDLFWNEKHNEYKNSLAEKHRLRGE